MTLWLALVLLAASAPGVTADPVLTTAGTAFPTGARPVSVAFGPQRPDGSGLLATANLLDRTVSLFTVSAGGVLNAAGPPAATGNMPFSVAFSPDGRLVATANSMSNSVSMFSTERDTLTPIGAPATTGAGPGSLAFSPDGTLLATSNGSGDSVSVFSVSAVGELTPVGAPTATQDGPVSVTFSRNGKLLVVANSNSESMSTFAVAAGGALTPLGSTPTGGRTQSVTFSPNADLLAVVNVLPDASVRMFSVSAGGELAPVGAPLPVAANPSGPAFSPDGRFFAIASGVQDRVFVYSVSTAGVLAPTGAPAKTGRGPVDVAFSPGGDFLAAVNSDGASVSMFRVSVGGALTPIGAPTATGAGPCAVRFSPAGGLLATANRNASISMFSASADGALTPVGAPTFVNGAPCAVAFSPDGGLLATGDGVNTALVFSVAPGGVLSLADDAPASGGTLEVAFSPAGGRIATAGWYGDAVSVFAVSAGGVLTPTGSAATGLDTVSLAFRPDGALLVAANEVGTLSVFSVSPSGALAAVGAPISTGRTLRSLAFSPDGELLATADSNSVSLFAVSATAVLTPVGPPMPVPVAQAVAFSPSGKLLAVTSSSKLSLYAVSETGELTSVGIPTPIQGAASGFGGADVAFSADGSLIAVTNHRQSTVSIYPLAAPNLDTAITSAPPAASRETTAVFEFEANYPSTLECRIDTASFAPCATQTAHTYAGLAEGPHTFTVRASDLLGNVEPSPPSKSWTVDVTAPLDVVLAQPASGAVRLRASPLFEWAPTSDNLTGVERYELWIDGVLSRRMSAGSCGTMCAAPPGAPLADGAHSWEVRAVDGAGNIAVSASRSFNVDAAPPGVFALLGPADDAATANRRPELSWQRAVDAGVGLSGYDVLVDDGVAASGLPATATSFTPAADLPDGVHRWRVVARDEYGNERTSATQRFTVDTLPPVAALTAAPNPALAGRSITFDAGGAADAGSGIARVEWDLDGDGAFETDTGVGRTAARSYAEPGTYAVFVRITDRAGLSATARLDQRVTATGSAGPLGVSINDGARYTRSPKVTITATWPLFATQMLVSNDGGFGMPVTLPLNKKTPWTLDSSGAERSSRLVYVRFQRGLTTSETYIDDIILDESRPSVASARVTLPRAARTPVLTLRARDRGLAGVGSVQVTNDRRNPKAKYRAYRAKVKLVSQPGYRRLNVRRTLYVRVRDRAGNVSSWRTVTRARASRG